MVVAEQVTGSAFIHWHNEMFSIVNKMMLVTTLLVCVAQMGYWFGKLPAIVPAHFDGQGNVDGEMGKVAFYSLFAGLHFLFLIGFPLLGYFLKKLPDSMINIPHREYWLAPERREETFRFNFQFLVSIGWITTWLMIGLFQLSALVGVKKRTTIEPEFYWMTGLYLVVITVMVIYLLVKFQRPSIGSPGESTTGKLEPTN